MKTQPIKQSIKQMLHASLPYIFLLMLFIELFYFQHRIGIWHCLQNKRGANVAVTETPHVL